MPAAAREFTPYRAPFDEQGFVVVPDFLPKAELAELREMMDQVRDGRLQPDRGEASEFAFQWEPRVKDDPSIAQRDKIRIVFHLAHTHSYFWRFIQQPRLLELVAALIGPTFNYYTDQTFFKPARHGSEVPWHQDSAYWPMVEPRVLSAWLALDPVTVANGCVRFIPGSHRRAVPHHEIVTDNPNKLTTKPDFVDPSLEVPVEMAAGSICLHHSLTLHRSFPNTSDQPRGGMVMIFMPADLEFYQPWPFRYGFPKLRG
jgi:phytanoyl-CoA hydroxylase